MNEYNTRFHFLYILLKALAVLNWDKEAELLTHQYKWSFVHFLSCGVAFYWISYGKNCCDCLRGPFILVTVWPIEHFKKSSQQADLTVRIQTKRREIKKQIDFLLKKNVFNGLLTAWLSLQKLKTVEHLDSEVWALWWLLQLTQRENGLTLNMVLPSWAGDMLTTTPADCSAAIFSLAPPLPPAMMAPACPILLPGGAVKPAMNDTTGLALAP